MGNLLLFIDDTRIYKFRIGDYVRIGVNGPIYHIKNMSPLLHDEACGEIAANSTGTKDFDAKLKPTDNYLYFIERMGIDGACKWRFQFPKGQTHFFPKNDITDYITPLEANRFKMKYMPYIIKSPHYPTIELSNSRAVANNSQMYFRGYKWYTKGSIDEIDVPAGARIQVITDYYHSGALAEA